MPGRIAIAEEIVQLRDSLVAVANSEYLGQPLFGGVGDGPAVEFDGASWTVKGSADDVIERRISPSESVRVNSTAGETFSADGIDAFTMLDELTAALQADDIDGINLANERIEQLRASLNGSHAAIGAVANRVQISIDRNSATTTVVTSQLSLVRDIDLAEAITQQKTLEAAYQAALGITARVGNLSLMDFLK